VDGRGGVPGGPTALTLAPLLSVVYTLRMDIAGTPITEFVAQIRRDPNPDDVLDWVYDRLRYASEGDVEDAILDARGMIEAYRDAQIALA
jgi:hypothetical protein